MTLENALTIFTCPKPFVGSIGTIQRNALRSWTLLTPRPRILLFGEGEGIAETAREFRAIYIPGVKCNELGTPVVSDIFARAERMAKGKKMLFTNADMIYNQSIVKAIDLVDGELEQYLALGQRWDIDVDYEIDFSGMNLDNLIRTQGIKHAPSGMDWMGFSRGQWGTLPDFLIGRAAWDGGVLARTLIAKIPVIDCTPCVLAIHQNHHYDHLKGGVQEAWNGEEAQRNKDLCSANGLSWFIDIWHSTYIMGPTGAIQKKKNPQPLPGVLRTQPAGRPITLTGRPTAIQKPVPPPVARIPSRPMPPSDRDITMTILTSLKPMRSPYDMLQRNALQSWTMLFPRPQIILFGDGEDIAKELVLEHIPEIEYSSAGAPLANSVFALAEKRARGAILCWINGDIIVTQSLMDMTARIHASLNEFLAIGRRWNLKVSAPIAFSQGNWWRNLRRRVQASGNLAPPDALDYLIFTPGLWGTLPPLRIGRAAWDGAIIALALKAGKPVVDATDTIFVVHQDHDYSHVAGGKNEIWNGKDAQENRRLVSDWAKTIAHTTHKMTQGGLFKKS